MIQHLKFNVGVPLASSGVTRPLLPAGEEDVGRHADHPAGHDGAGRLRRLAELHPQPVVRVGQVQRVGRLPEQAQPGQETGQPAGDGALLLQREFRPASLPHDATSVALSKDGRRISTFLQAGIS